MNSTEYLGWMKELQAAVAPGSLRAALYSREGVMETEHQIDAGRRAFAVERSGEHRRRPETTIVFGACASDARRRAGAPARLGEEMYGDRTEARPIITGWDEAITWPFPRRLRRDDAIACPADVDFPTAWPGRVAA